MKIDLSTVMKEAWAIVRRLRKLGERSPLWALLSRALKSAWWDAKKNARIAAASAARLAELQKDRARGSAEIFKEIVSLENKTRLGSDGMGRLSELRAAYSAALKREGGAA
jgi:hypothetical protein